MKKKSFLFRNIGEVLTMAGAFEKQSRKIQEADLGFEKKQSMLVEDGRIVWIGPDKKTPKIKVQKEINLMGRTLLPGFVECHTHTLFSGHRADELEMKNKGLGYLDIAAAGGGIVSTVRKTRAASAKDLLQQTQKKVDRFVQQGVTTLEVKSGYALDLKNEMKSLEVIGQLSGPQIVPTFLGAHAIPPDAKNQEQYLKFLEQQVIPQIKKRNLSKRLDIFIESGFFSFDAAKKYLLAGKKMGFDIVIHADQITLNGGTKLACEIGAISCDHVLQVMDPEIQALAKSETTAVLLPSADFYLQCAFPKARKMIDAGVRVALATDYNPGSSPTQDLSFVGILARLEMKMSLPEVISAYTVGAAFALGLQNEVGALIAGHRADFLVLEKEWRELFYRVGEIMPLEIYRSGQIL